jgi:hypothetical protein
MSASQTATEAPRANDGARPSDEEILGLPTATKATPPARAKTPRAVQSRTISNSSAVGAKHAVPAPDRPTLATAKSVGAVLESPAADSLESSSSDRRASDAPPAETDPAGASSAAAEEPENYRAIFDANPDLRDAWQSAQAYRDIFPDIEQARALQKIFPTPADAERATAQLAELERLDSMFFSNRPESLAELAATVYRLNPEAFANLARVMAGMTSNATEAQRHRELTNDENRNSTIAHEKTVDAGARHAVPDSGATTTPPASAVARAAFFEDTNAATVEGVVQVIESQVDRLLPEGIAPGARNRVIGEVYRELDTTLRGNRALARQVREAFHSGAFDADQQRAIVGMIVGRARQALPGVAKKVIEEWTSSVLAASSARLARQRTAERRVDIAGAGPAASEARRPLSPSDLDYAKLSDADILNL